MQYAGASPAGRGGGQSPYRKLIVKPPPAPKASTATIITARRTEYPPNSPHGRGQTENVQLGVRLRRGLANPRNLILDAWSSSCLQEAIRNARCAVPLSRLTHALTHSLLAPRSAAISRPRASTTSSRRRRSSSTSRRPTSWRSPTSAPSPTRPSTTSTRPSSPRRSSRSSRLRCALRHGL